MKKFILPNYFDGSPTLTLHGDDFHYLIRVLRMKVGASFAGMDRTAGIDYKISIQKIGASSCLLSIEQESGSEKKGREISGTHIPGIVLFQCIPKGRKFDQIIRQATEAGVTKIIPVLSEYSIPRYDESPGKKDRWMRIVQQALQQSGSKIMPEITGLLPFREISEVWNGQGVGLFFHPEILANEGLHSSLTATTGPVCIFIGPEGGFSENEVDYLLTHGVKPIYLGGNVLRTETAALYAIASVRTVLAEKNEWQSKKLN